MHFELNKSISILLGPFLGRPPSHGTEQPDRPNKEISEVGYQGPSYVGGKGRFLHPLSLSVSVSVSVSRSKNQSLRSSLIIGLLFSPLVFSTVQMGWKAAEKLVRHWKILRGDNVTPFLSLLTLNFLFVLNFD